MRELLTNPPFIAALLAVVTAQILKIVFTLIFDRRLEWETMLSTGGMPSSHTATVTALTVSLAMTEGLSSPLVAMTIVFSIVVIYDAVGIRRAAGKHAEVLNEWSRILSETFEHGFQPEDLKTLLGHTYPQVIAGIILGSSMGFLVTYLMTPAIQ